jgi:signal transduction histidine kinase/ActR/RegA family two-component response regulator
VTATQSTENTTKPVPEPTPRDLSAETTATATILAQLLGAFAREEGMERFLGAVSEILARGLRLEGVLVLVRHEDMLRAVAGAGPGLELGAIPPVPLDLHPWPETAEPLLLSPDTVANILPRMPVRWRGLHLIPLRVGGALQGAMYLGSAPSHPLTAEETGVLRTVGEALGPELVRRQKESDLRAASRAREEALAVVAHDLRNPLHAISVGVGTLLPRIAEPTLRRPVERIQRSAQRMERLLQDLLDIHAIEGGRFTVETGRVTPTALILTALESQQSVAGKTSVIINTDVAPALPTVEADEERVLQVLENLVGNALKFTPPGGVITVGAARIPGDLGVRFWVRDTGPGIAREHLPRVFERFFQVQAADRRGAGLGLAICKAIVDAHGGRIWVESEQGQGAAFFFTLPTAPEDPDAASVPAEPAVILLVDDKPENLTALAAILERPDYRLISATSGEEALRVALRERFAAALIDVAMPRMNGLEVATHLKALERSRHIPIIFITAFGDDPEEIHRAYAAGGADYLVKPLDPEIVRKKVAVFVELSRKRHESESAAPNDS